MTSFCQACLPVDGQEKKRGHYNFTYIFFASFVPKGKTIGKSCQFHIIKKEKGKRQKAPGFTAPSMNLLKTKQQSLNFLWSTSEHCCCCFKKGEAFHGSIVEKVPSAWQLRIKWLWKAATSKHFQLVHNSYLEWRHLPTRIERQLTIPRPLWW